MLGVAAFVLAYVLRFESGLIPISRAIRPFSQYVNVLPFVGVLVPFAFHVQGLYRLRRGRSRVDDFFAVFVGSILAVVFGIVATLYFQAYCVPDELKDRGAYEVSQLVWGIFLVLNVLLTFASRELVREALERRWRAGIGLKRILIAGSGELGRLVADKVLEHRELGLPHRRVRGRPRRRRLPRASRACRFWARSTKPATSPCANASTTSTSRCPPKSTSGCCSCST